MKAINAAARIRDASPSDAPAITTMIHELVAYEGTNAPLSFTEADLAAALSGPDHKIRAIVAEDGIGLLGFVTYTVDFAIWTGGRVLRVDDLFVRERARGQGIGKLLMGRVAQLGLEHGMTARWEIEVGNTKAQGFYRQLGVTLKDKIVARWDLESMQLLRQQLDAGS